MADIFISYAAEDRSKIEPLVEAIKNNDWSVWWDREIPVAKAWHQVIEEELDKANCIIVVWSKASVVSDWVHAEAEEALKKRIMVPVIFEKVQIPIHFRSIQAANLFQWDGDESRIEFKQLVRAIENILGDFDGGFDGVGPR